MSNAVFSGIIYPFVGYNDIFSRGNWVLLFEVKKDVIHQEQMNWTLAFTRNAIFPLLYTQTNKKNRIVND